MTLKLTDSIVMVHLFFLTTRPALGIHVCSGALQEGDINMSTETSRSGQKLRMSKLE